MQLERAETPAALAAAEAFLVAHADPIRDLLPLADLRPPLGRIATAYLGREGGHLVALAFAFPLWPASPALGVLALPGHGAAAVAALAAVAPARAYVICAREERAWWEAAGRAEPGHRELHLTLGAASWQAAPREGVRLLERADLPALDAFFRTHRAGAWHPLQFETGPYVAYEQDGEIVAAAGTHFSYPALAQVGNVLTAEAWRGRGLAARCTTAVVDRLVALGHETISLFVAEENAVAVRVYERLGFGPCRTLEAFPWARRPAPGQND